MTNFEKYKDEIIEITKVSRIAVVGGKPCFCSEVPCSDCEFHNRGNCKLLRYEWAAAEVEPTMNANEAWDLAYRVVFGEELSFPALEEIFGTINRMAIMRDYTPYEVKEKIEAWKKRKKLKPCPFCGSTTAVEIYKKDDHNYAINCNYEKGGCGTMSGYSVTKGEAIKLWNKRSGE